MTVPSKITWFDPGPKVYWRGRWWDEAMVLALTEVERLTNKVQYFYQGSFNRGVAASGGTHDKGAVGDGQSLGLTHRKEQSRVGVVSWARTRAQGFTPHDHFFGLGFSTASNALKAQMLGWIRGENGLANRRKDDSGVRGTFRTWKAWRKAIEPVAPNAYLDGINLSRKMGSKVRPYNSVKLLQTALNKIYNLEIPLVVDGVYGPLTTAMYDKFRGENFQTGTVGEVGSQSLKLLFQLAEMKVNVRARKDGPAL